mgnify:FL=1
MRRVKTFLVQLLFDKKIENFPEFDNNKFWDNLVKLGSNQLIIPTIYSKLKERKLLNKIPSGLKSYLLEIYTFNTLRNKSFLKETAKIEKKLTQNKIDFIFLKGISLLRTVYKNNIGIRMMHDIDILIKESQIYQARECLKELEYKSDDSEEVLSKHRHLPIMINSKKNIGVELHHQLILNDILNLDNKRIFMAENKNCLNIKNNIAYIIFNSEVYDNGTLIGTINLRSKFDFFQLNKLENNFNYNNNFYSKAFITKMIYLKIIENRKEQSLIYFIYLVLSKYFGIGLFISVFITNIQRVKNIFQSKKYRISSYNKIKSIINK